MNKLTFDKACELYAQAANSSVAAERFNELIANEQLAPAQVTTSDGHVGLNWCWGGQWIAPTYDRVLYYSASCIPVQSCYAICTRGNKDYLVGPSGKALFEAMEILPAGDSMLPVRFTADGFHYGMANRHGEVILEPEYEHISQYGNGYWLVDRDGEFGLITPWGDVIEPQFSEVDVDADGYIVVTYDGVKGYLDELNEFTTRREEAYHNYDTIID